MRRSPSTLCSSVCWHRCTPEPCCWPAWIRASLALRLRVGDSRLPLTASGLDTGRRRSCSPGRAALRRSPRGASHRLRLLAPSGERRQAGPTPRWCRLTELRGPSAWSPWAGCWAGWDEEAPAGGERKRRLRNNVQVNHESEEVWCLSQSKNLYYYLSSAGLQLITTFMIIFYINLLA